MGGMTKTMCTITDLNSFNIVCLHFHCKTLKLT